MTTPPAKASPPLSATDTVAEHADHFALVVGIDDYPSFRSLNGARQDARDFHTWLIDDADGGGIPEQNVELVLSASDPVRPIHEDVDDALERILIAAKRGPAARFYLYFSGHGLARSNLGTDLCLARWSKWRRAMALDSVSYLNLVMGCGFFSEVVFLLDCCRVREVRSTALPSTIELPGPGDDAPKSRSFVAYATEYQNAAFEAETGNDDAGDEEALVRGHFTLALLEALRGAAADPGGGVRASKLKEYLEVRTPVIADRHHHVQRSEVVNGLKSDTEPLFGSARPKTQGHGVNVHVSFQPHRVGEVIVEDGQLQVLRQGDASSGPWRVVVAGRNLLLIRHPTSGDEKIVRVDGDEEGDIHVEF